MAGFYVYNNVGIAFRCFATGVLFGLGSAFFLVYNGLFIGAVAGLVTAAGHGKNLLTFTCTHGAFELTAIVISATAGMVMGYALVDTGGLSRFASLRTRARDIAYLVLGAALMLLIAAGIEGFWSPSSVPARVKWGTAIAAYLFVILYLALAGGGARHGNARRSAAAGRIVNLLASRVVLRQRSLADVLDLAIPFCLMNKRPLGVLSLIVLGPLAALAAYLRIARHWDWDGLWVLIGCAGVRARRRVHRRAGRAAVSGAAQGARARPSCAASSAGWARAWSRTSCAPSCWRRRPCCS